jgi:hypothetical protein
VRPSTKGLFPPALNGAGNHFNQFVAALAVALTNDIRLIFLGQTIGHWLPLFWGLFNYTFYTKSGIMVVPKAPDQPDVLRARFWLIWPCYRTGTSLGRMRIVDEIRDEFMRVLPAPRAPLEPDMLVVMLRGGDIMELKPPTKPIGQPPCMFYREIIRGFRRVVLVTVGGNPCHDEIMGMKGVEWWNGSLFEDISVIAHSHNFAAARSSFAFMGMYLSPFRKRQIWTFDDETYAQSCGNAADFQPRTECVASKEFRRIVIQGGSPKNRQIAEILTGSCIWRNITG